MSPELFDPESFGLKDGRPTKQSDRYAIGMLIHEVLSGQVPFPRHHGYAVVVRILKGERPARPQGAEGAWFTDDVWSILQRCWEPTPGDRPRIRDVLQCLEKASRSWTPPSQTVAVPLTTGPPARNSDSSGGEWSDEGEVSSLSQGVSSQPLHESISRGDQNESHI